ncbi:TOBE domain-containing protein, partial [Streptomyces sp. NPDC059468]
EKIRVLKESAEADEPGHATVTGTVAEVVYLGDATRFLVDLDGGGRLTALQQNLETSSADVAAYRGTRVRLRWHHGHAVRIPS